MAGARRVTALEQLVEKVRHGRAAGILPAEWETLAETALAEVADLWETERLFRRRTGASDKWCRQHFTECEAEGLARLNGKRREWHRHARIGKKVRLEPRELKREIVSSFQRSA
jgi:hypothetical protein